MKGILSVLVALLAILAIALAYNIGADKPAQVVNQTNTVEKIQVVVDNATLAEVAALKEQIASLDEFTSKADEKAQNDTAKALVLEEIAEKSFLKDLLAVLNDDYDIEDYKDLTVSSVEIEESELDGDEATVLVTLKVEFDNYGDSDYSKKATVEVEFVVTDLVVDDDMEDAEVDSYDIEVLRVKDLD